MTSEVLGTRDWFPLTPMQEAYLVGQSGAYHLGSIPCLAYFQFEVPDADFNRLEKAWNTLIGRHESLRTVFSVLEGQRVLEHVPYYEFARAGSLCLDEVKANLTRDPHDPAEWPLFRCASSTDDEGRTYFHVSLNVLIADGQSIQILFSELTQIYERPEINLPPLTYSFREYCEALKKSSGLDREAEEFWNQRLTRLCGPPALPFATHPSLVQEVGFRRVSGRFDQATWASLKREAARRRLSPSTVFLTSYARVLSRYSRNRAFRLGVTTFSRPDWHPGLEAVIGDFTGLVAFPLHLQAVRTFADDASEIQAMLWEDLSQFSLPVMQLTRGKLNRFDDGEAVGLPVVFTSLLGRPRSAGDWILRDGLTQTPQVWIDHQVAEVPDGVLFYWDVPVGLFPEGVIEAMFEEHRRNLTLAAEGTFWDRLPEIVPPPPCDPARSAVLPIWPAERGPQAVITDTRAVSYDQLEAAARWIERELRSACVAKGDRVGIVLGKGWEQIAAVLACARSGAVFVPIDPGAPVRRQVELFGLCEIKIVITRSCDASDHWELCSIMLPQEIEDVPPSESAERTSIDLDDLVYVIFTSGSTGTPKGVAVDHRACSNTVIDLIDRLQLTTSDRVLSLSALNFDLSVFDIFGLLGVGGAIVMPPDSARRDPQEWVLLMNAHHVTVWNTVPALMEMLVEYLEASGTAAPRDLRHVLLSGDWIPVGLPGRIRRLFPDAQIISLGGATEASIWSIIYPIEEVESDWTTIPYGKALSGQTVDVYDDALSRAPEWVVGEICIGGAGLAAGYWGDRVRTDERFVAHPVTGERLYRTGDLGRRWADGTIELLGREDRQVKLNGFRIELGEIEAHLAQHPDVSSALALLDAKRVIAYVVPTVGAEPQEASILEFVRQRVPEYLVPSRVIPIDQIPLTANGKVDRSALSVPAAGSQAAEESDIERRLCQIVGELLGISTPSIESDFFGLGGTSIQLIRLHQGANREFGISCALREIVSRPSLKAMAGVIAQHKAHAPSGSLATPPTVSDEAELFEPFPLTPLQQAYWIGRRADFELGRVAPHVYLEFESPEFDVSRAERAWNRLIGRHPALRTIFSEDATQRILEDVPAVRFTVHDLSDRPEVEVSRCRQEIRARLSHQTFDPATWPLFELHVSIGEKASIWHLSLDLLIGDAWSMRILASEFSALYEDSDLELPDLEDTFRDWVVSRRDREEAGARAQAVAYWTEQIERLPPPPRLKLLRSPASVEQPLFERRRFVLDADAWASFRAKAAAHGISAVNALMAAFASSLRAGGAGDQFLLNVTFFDRGVDRRGMLNVVGDYTSLLLVNIEWRSDASFSDNAKLIQTRLLEAISHSEISAVEVMRLAAPKRQLIAPVVFTSTLGFPQQNEAQARFPFREVYSVSQTPQVWLDHQLIERDNELHVIWDSVGELFDDAYLDSLFDQYAARLRQLASGPSEDWGGEGPAETRGGEPTLSDPNAANSVYMDLYSRRPAIRQDLSRSLPLRTPQRLATETMARESCREFAAKPLPLDDLSRLLAVLCELRDLDRFVPKRSYGSAGSLYPVQTYLTVAEGGVDGLEPGNYYLNPESAALAKLGQEVLLAEAPPNCGFAILMVACLPAVVPAYGERSMKFALIEAGLMTQALELKAAGLGIGLCQIGAEPPEGWRSQLEIDDDHAHLHTIIGGVPMFSRTVGEAVFHPRQSQSETGSRSEQAYAEPAGGLSAELAHILADVLELEFLAPESNFFEAGGDSVLCVRAAARASKLLGFEISLRDLLENPTAAGWAAAIVRRRLAEIGDLSSVDINLPGVTGEGD